MFKFEGSISESSPPPKKEGFRYTFDCPYCHVNTNGHVLFANHFRPNQYIELPKEQWIVKVFAVACTRCGGIVTLFMPFDQREPVCLSLGPFRYPLPKAGSISFGDDERFVPLEIMKDYSEGEMCVAVNSLMGAGLLFRRSIQLVCREKGAEPGRLVDEINWLAKENMITTEMASFAHSLRIVGNEIAHPDPAKPTEVTIEDIEACRGFLLRIIDILYIQPGKNKALKDKFEKKKEN